MKQINVAVESLAAKIKTYSSCIDSLHQPTNILHPSQSTLWATGQGIPQFVIVSLQDLTLNFKSITQVGFMLWHDYDTNPKQIELWVAQTTQQEFVFWARFQLQQKKGIQLYQIKPLPSHYIYLKISITETYGAFQTYLNQVFFMAQGIKQRPKTSKELMVRHKKQLDLQDLQSGLNHLVEIDRRISRSKSNKKQQKKLNQMSRRSELQNQHVEYQSSNNLKLKGEKYAFRPQISKGSLSSNKPGRSIYFRSDDYYQDYDEDSHRIVSNDYQSSSSNPKESIRQGKAKKKISSQESQDFSHSLQSNNTALSPSINRTNTLTYKQQFFSRQAIEAHQKQEDNRISYKTLIDREKAQNSKKKTKEYSYEGEESNFNSQKKQKHEIKEEQLQDQEQRPQLEESQEEFANNFIENTPKYNQVFDEQIQGSQIEDQQLQQSQNYNAAIMALSKHVVKIQDNMESIQRKVEVLDLKITHSHHKIQQSILNRVETHVQQIVDRKLNKIYSLKNIHFINKINSAHHSHSKSKHVQQNDSSNTKTNHEQNLNYKKNLTKEFFKSQYYAQQQNMAQMRDRTKTKRRSKQKYQNNRSRPDLENDNFEKAQRRLKGSKSFTNITHKYNRGNEHNQNVNNEPNKNPNQQYIVKLLQRLNAKLKERQVKLNKMQIRSKQKNINNPPDKRKVYGLKERQNNRRERCDEVYNHHYY